MISILSSISHYCKRKSIFAFFFNSQLTDCHRTLIFGPKTNYDNRILKFYGGLPNDITCNMSSKNHADTSSSETVSLASFEYCSILHCYNCSIPCLDPTKKLDIKDYMELYPFLYALIRFLTFMIIWIIS